SSTIQMLGVKTSYSMTVVLATWPVRFGLGFFVDLVRGLENLRMLLSGTFRRPPLFGLSPAINLGLATFLEFVAGLAVLVGFKTRLASLGLIGIMFVAGIIVHFSDPLFAMSAGGGPSKEMALLYLLAFAGTMILGSGRYSVDALIGKK